MEYYEDAIGQIICRGDTVTLLDPSAAAAAADGNHCAVVLWKGRPGPNNKVLVRRLDGTKATVNCSDVRVVDRSFLQPSMVVASSTDTGGQLGMVMCAATELDVARLPSPADGNGDDENAAPAVVARAVSPAEVRRAGGEFSVGDYVVSSAAGAEAAAWLGCVVEVCVDVDVVFDDGAACRVAWGHIAELWATTATVNKNGSKNKDLYPGQRVGGPPGTFRASRWLKGYWKPCHGEGTVARVETTCVLVYWVASSSSQLDTADEDSLPPPANQQSPRDLTFLCLGPGNIFDYKYWGVGDRCFFRSGGAASDDHDPQQQSSAAHGLTRRDWRQLWRQRRPGRRQRSLDGDVGRRPLVVASTRTTVDVLWQDGTRRRGVPSTSLVVWEGETDNDLFPGQHVVRRTPSTEPPPEEEDECVGVVRGYNYKDKTVRVSWDLLESDEEETLSAYDVRGFSYDDDDSCIIHYGDIVVRRRRQLDPTTDSPSSSTRTSTSDLSWVGQHVYYECECDQAQYIYVMWGDGNTSKVLFREIAIVKERSIDDLLHELGEWVHSDRGMDSAIDEARENVAADDDDDDNDDNNNNINGEEDDNSSIDGDDGSGIETDDDSSGSESDSKDDSHASMTRMNQIRVIIPAVIGLAGKVFSQGWRYLVKSEDTATESIIGEVLSGSNHDVKVTSTAEAGINGGSSSCGGSNAEEKSEEDGTPDDKPFSYPQFEIVQQCPSDHHYLDMKQDTSGGRKWTKRVQKEWKILENNNLPDTIYVRAFEDRMDLLRAVMVGASGTPYHDGLFFFDLQLPPSYPAVPPLVNYRSFGLDVNPNLYPSGTVCLSLLNTFGARDEAELWSPAASTVLQVVVSIQGLVLTAQPYYNEPAWAQAGTTMGQRNELPYSESTFLRSLQTMLHLLRRPPAGFEEFVGDHFRRRGQCVVRACEAYRDGCLVGTLDGEGNPTEGSRERPCSAGFRIALLNVLPRLVEAYANLDA